MLFWTKSKVIPTDKELSSAEAGASKLPAGLQRHSAEFSPSGWSPTNPHIQKEDQEAIWDGYYSVCEEKILKSGMFPLWKVKVTISEDWSFQKEKVKNI